MQFREQRPVSQMTYRRLGRSGLTVSRIVLGTMMFGRRTEEATSRQIIDHAAERGCNFIDTADTYAGGRSEEIVGRAIAGNRDWWVLATKLANPNGRGPNARGLSRKWIMEEAKRSLTRLGTDFVDILYLHKEDALTPPEETVRAIADLRRQGLIRYIGVSNFKAWRIARICAACDALGVDRPIVSQPMYHALNRTVEVEALPVCDAMGIGVVVYSPTARGVLTGKYRDGAKPEDSRAAVEAKRMAETEFQPAALEASAKIAAHAEARGYSPAAFATAWTLANPFVTGAIAGPRTMEQWQSYLDALEVTITEEDEALVNSLVPAGTTAVHQFIDASYPVEGRPRRAG
jgi:aryl-alcohol dehydrogenase-like predicted oxidoreductase